MPFESSDNTTKLILQLLTPEDLGHLAQVSKKLKKLSEANEVWEKHLTGPLESNKSAKQQYIEQEKATVEEKITRQLALIDQNETLTPKQKQQQKYILKDSGIVYLIEKKCLKISEALQLTKMQYYNLRETKLHPKILSGEYPIADVMNLEHARRNKLCEPSWNQDEPALNHPII